MEPESCQQTKGSCETRANLPTHSQTDALHRLRLGVLTGIWLVLTVVVLYSIAVKTRSCCRKRFAVTVTMRLIDSPAS